MSQTDPDSTDAILGGQNPPPIDAAVLGGEIGRQRKLQHEKAIARQNKFWQNFEYLEGLPDRYAAIFADRQVVNFEPGMQILNPKETAYALRGYYSYHGSWRYLNFTEPGSIQDKCNLFLQAPRVNEVEALVFGHEILWFDYVKFLVEHHQWLNSLKSLFIGDIVDSEKMISDLSFGKDVSPILSVYPELEIFHIRCGGRRNNLYFSEWLHHNLKAIRIESSGLNRSAITSLCQLELPALEYLELWTGSEEYGSNSSIYDVMPIISGEKFPKLKYLGIKNCEYTNEVVAELVKSPLMDSLIELDLAMGNLDMEGFSMLIDSPKIRDLDKINLSKNFLDIRHSLSNTDAYDALAKLCPAILELKCKFILDRQRIFSYPAYAMRYCAIRE
jgi:hypothetical protein